jgi:hypothetical protein
MQLWFQYLRWLRDSWIMNWEVYEGGSCDPIWGPILALPGGVEKNHEDLSQDGQGLGKRSNSKNAVFWDVTPCGSC